MNWSKRSTWEKIKLILGFLSSAAGMIGIMSLSYWLNPYVLRWLGWEVEGYWLFVMDSAAAVLLLLIGGIIAYPFAVRKQNVFYQSITDALKRIAKGEFNVSIKAHKDFELEYATILDSIHEMADELSEMEKLRQEFISNVSHEIQSPLTSIRGFAQALQNEELTAEQRHHYLQIIETETMRLSKLSDNLMKLTSLESEYTPMETSEYRLDQQLRSIALTAEPQWQQKQLELELNLDKVLLNADPEMMSQVWINLLHNAIKFTPVRGTISIGLHQAADHIEVSIRDTGAGIAAEHIPHIFERFFKADVSRNRTLGGNGLGLSIVKKIVELHQGSIQVSSKLGEGTTFIVRLPKSLAHTQS